MARRDLCHRRGAQLATLPSLPDRLSVPRLDARTHRANRLAAAEAANQLEVLAAETGADELLVTTIAHRHADRMRPYELLAAGERAGGRGVGKVCRRSGCGCECQVRSAVSRLGEQSDDDRARHPFRPRQRVASIRSTS